MIQLTNLSYAYPKSNTVLSNLSTKICAGKIHGLLGCNGTGKSTLIKLICGLLHSEQGNVTIDGENPSLRLPSTLAKISYLPEEPFAPNITIMQYAAALRPFYASFSDDILNKCLKAFDVPQEKRLIYMSLGQRKKALISLTLALNTPLIVLDEPTNGLDIPSKATFRDIISSTITPDKTVIISTHQVHDIEAIITSALLIHDGKMMVNSPITHIAERFYFGPVTADDDPLFYESTLTGSVGVKVNTDTEFSEVNLEMFFNAAIANPETVTSILSK